MTQLTPEQRLEAYIYAWLETKFKEERDDYICYLYLRLEEYTITALGLSLYPDTYKNLFIEIKEDAHTTDGTLKKLEKAINSVKLSQKIPRYTEREFLEMFRSKGFEMYDYKAITRKLKHYEKLKELNRKRK